MPWDEQRAEGTGGFILPWVLVFILVVSSLSVIGIRAAERGQRLVLALEAQQAAERRLRDSEHRALFTLLTNRSQAGGVVVAAPGQSAPQAPTGFDTVADSTPAQLWPVVDGRRRDSNGVDIVLQDATGLLGLNHADTGELSLFLQSFAVDRDSADRLAARLADYRDADNRRQFLGAERAEYRLLNKPLPTQSPLRSYDELANVLGWEDYRHVWRSAAFIASTSLSPRLAGVHQAFVPDHLRRRLADQGALDFAAGEIDAVANNIAALSFHARLTLSASYQGLEGPLIIERIVEVERLPIGLEGPFRRYHIADRRYRGSIDDRRSAAALIPADAADR